MDENKEDLRGISDFMVYYVKDWERYLKIGRGVVIFGGLIVFNYEYEV